MAGDPALNFVEDGGPLGSGNTNVEGKGAPGKSNAVRSARVIAC